MTQTQTHWKKLTNPDYIGAYALDPGKDMILTMKGVTREIVTGADGKKEECTMIRFAEPVKPMIANKTNCKMIEKIYKTPYIEEWTDKQIQIYVEHNIRVGKETTDGLRIRPFIPKPASQTQQSGPVCADCGEPVAEYQGITAAQLAAATNKKYGRPLCYGCSVEAKKQTDPLGGEQIAINS